MEFMDVIRQRRSIRKFKSDPIPENIIDEILEAGRLSPSGGNGQNWFFGVITDRAQRERLAEAAGGQSWVASAPCILAICTKIDWDLSKLPEDDFGLAVNRARFTPEFIRYQQEYPNQKAVSTLFLNSAPFIPGEQMFLAAVNRGLGACWIGLLDIEKANRILKLPDDVICLNLIPIGYPDEKASKISRKPVDEIVFRDLWKR